MSFMYQMICRVLERLHPWREAMPGQIGTGTQIDEVIYGRTHRRWLVARRRRGAVLGVSERTGPAWRDRSRRREPTVLNDRRLGRLSARRAPVDEVARVLELFDTRYWDFTAKHLPREAGGRSRLQAQLQLAAAELRISPWAQARGAQAWGAPAQASAPCPARHDVAPGRLDPRLGSPVDGGT